MAEQPTNHEEGPLVESEPTIVYRPVAPMDETADTQQRVAGAFRYALVIESGPQAGLAYVLGEGETLAGRSDDTGIFLGDVTVSRHHAKFVVDGSGLRVEDLGSTNGTYVNRSRYESAELRPGDEVIIGKFHLIVTVGNA